MYGNLHVVELLQIFVCFTTAFTIAALVCSFRHWITAVSIVSDHLDAVENVIYFWYECIRFKWLDTIIETCVLPLNQINFFPPVTQNQLLWLS